MPARRESRGALRTLLAASALIAVLAMSSSDRVSENASTYILLGYTTWSHARSLTEVNRAVAYFRQALQIAPMNGDAHAGLADSLISLALRVHNRDAMVRAADSALRQAYEAVYLAPVSDEAHAALGQAQAEFGDASVAERELWQALSLNSHSVEARTWYGELLFSQGRLREADAQFRAAVAINSPWTEADDNLSLLAYLRGDLREAEAFARESLVLAPDDHRACMFLAVSESARAPAQAEAEILGALHWLQGPSALAGHALLAYLYAKENRMSSAIAHTRQAQAIAGRIGAIGDPFTIVSLAAAYGMQHRRDDAFVLLARMDKIQRHIFKNDFRLNVLRGDARFSLWASS